jgi:hypothetical protein
MPPARTPTGTKPSQNTPKKTTPAPPLHKTPQPFSQFFTKYHEISRNGQKPLYRPLQGRFLPPPHLHNPLPTSIFAPKTAIPPISPFFDKIKAIYAPVLSVSPLNRPQAGIEQSTQADNPRPDVSPVNTAIYARPDISEPPGLPAAADRTSGPLSQPQPAILPSGPLQEHLT